MSAASERKRFAGFAAASWLLNTSAQRTHRSAIRVHVTLLVGSRVNLAIRWQSVACLKFLGWIHRPVLLMVKLRATSPLGETVPHIRKAAASTGLVHATSSAPCRRPLVPRIERIRSHAADMHLGGPWRLL